MTSKLTITDERLAELVAFKPLPGTDINSATRDEWMAMAAELHERRKAAMDREPVAYMYDGEDGREYNGHNEFSGGGKGIPLYRHAQQPLVPDNRAITQHFDTIALETAREILCDVNRRHEFLGGEVQLLSRIQCRIDAACRAAILQAQSDDDGEPTDDERIMAIEGIHNCERCGDEGWVMGEMGITRCACGQAGNSPVIGIDLASGPDRTVEVRYVAPPGYVMVPMRLTAENGAKGALSGEFSESKFVNCPECFGDDECETCDGSGRIEIAVPVTWTTIKEIWAKGVEHFSATPREVKGE